MTVVSEQGKEASSRNSGTWRFFGEGCLNGHPLRVTTATAIERIPDYAESPKQRSSRTIHEEPEFSELFIADLLAVTVELRRTSSINYSIQARNGWRGLFCFWRILARKATTEPIIGKFSQETLAEMIGTTRSRVSFFMNKFRKLGYIEYNGKLEIRNSLLNVVLYDKP